jgi:hypothetical protein
MNLFGVGPYRYAWELASQNLMNGNQLSESQSSLTVRPVCRSVPGLDACVRHGEVVSALMNCIRMHMASTLHLIYLLM